MRCDLAQEMDGHTAKMNERLSHGTRDGWMAGLWHGIMGSAEDG